MAEQLGLLGWSAPPDTRPRRLGIPARYIGDGRAVLDALGELRDVVEHGPFCWPIEAPGGVLPFDPMDAETETKVREWAARHRVQLWEGRL